MREVAGAFSIVVVSVMVSLLLGHWFLPLGGILLVLQLGAAAVALLYRKLLGIVAAIGCALSFNYFFTEPRLSLRMDNGEDIINMLVFVAVALLISELVAYYRRQQIALRLARMQADILLSVSHDLRTPLATIIGSMETMLTYQGKLPEAQQRELLQGARDEGHRLHHYIENLLQATRLHHNGLLAGRDNVDISTVLSRVQSRFSSNRLVVHSPTRVLICTASEPLLQQALYNIIDNALKYSDDAVVVEAHAMGEQVRIEVSDSGPGIGKTECDSLFTAFSSTRQGDSGAGGIGLGLTVAHGIVRAHGGQLTLENAQSGCIARIILPATGGTGE